MLNDKPVQTNAPMKSDRPQGWLDLLRHLMIVAVIFQHMPAANRYPPELNACISSLTLATDGAVAGFFLISGYFARPGTGGRYLLQRVFRLLVPYVVFSVIYAVILIALGKIDALLAIGRILSGAGIGPQLYYLPYLALISVALSFAAARERIADMRMILLFLFIAYVVIDTPTSTGPDIRLLLLYTLSYSLGIYIARYGRSVEIFALLVGALFAVFWFPWTSRYFDLPFVILLFFCMLHVSRLVPITRRLPGSGGIYLLHTPILNFAISTALWRIGLLGITNVAVTIILTYLAALALTISTIRYAPRYRWLLLE